MSEGQNRDTRIACEGCGFTLGWLVRFAGQHAIVRNPLVKLELLMDSHRWVLSCPRCGVRWQGMDAIEARLLVA